MSSDHIVKKLEKLLARQAQHLKSGNISGAFALGPAIEKLVEKLEAAEEPVASVAQLNGPATRNADLLQAAKRGVETARAVLVDAKNPDGFQSYDAQGRATRIGP